MGILLETEENSITDQVLDTIVIFILGSILIFFFHTMVNKPRTFLISYATYIVVLIIALLFYINQFCAGATQQKSVRNVINFMAIYTICLNALLVFVISQEFV